MFEPFSGGGGTRGSILGVHKGEGGGGGGSHFVATPKNLTLHAFNILGMNMYVDFIPYLILLKSLKNLVSLKLNIFKIIYYLREESNL